MPLISRDVSGEICETNPSLCKTLEEIGYEVYNTFSTEALQEMMELLDKMGYKEQADIVYEHMVMSEEYWAERYYMMTGEPVAYDYRSKRWRSMITGRFVPDPYKYLWGE